MILSGVLIASGVAKLRRPEEDAAWAELGIPSRLRRPLLIRVHPWAELALAIALLLLGGLLGLVAALLALGLFGIYLVLVSRRRADSPGAVCSCFGSRRPITAVTVVRNVWLVFLALVAVAVTWTTPLLGGTVLGLEGDRSWVVALAAAALTVGLILWEPPASGATADAGVPVVTGTAEAAEPGEYLRARTPAVPVQFADGRTVNLRDLAARGPILLLAVKEDCTSCTAVIESVPRWREMLPEVAVRLLLWPSPENSALTELDEPQSLHDPYMYVRGSIADWSTPAAVLLGADGYLAGGPVSGSEEVSEFVAAIHQSLHGERHQG